MYIIGSAFLETTYVFISSYILYMNIVLCIFIYLLIFLSHPTNATRRNHFSTSFSFSFFTKITKNHQKNIIFHIVSPRKGTLTLTPGMEVGGDHLGPKIFKIPKESFVRRLFTLVGHFSKNVEKYL